MCFCMWDCNDAMNSPMLGGIQVPSAQWIEICGNI